ARFGPLLDLAADRIRIAADRHAVGEQLLVRARAELRHHRLLAARGREAHAVELGVIVAIVPARRRARDVLAGAIILMAAGQCESSDVLVRGLADELPRIGAADRLA